MVTKKSDKVSERAVAPYAALLTKGEIEDFQNEVYSYYEKHKRSFPWREEPSPYRTLVSEIMLQQTQTSRVVEKFQQFMSNFPSVEKLAQASLAEVLSSWQGLGYNRRAKFLHLAAQAIVEKHGGVIPSSFEELEALPGIGHATAGAILAYAFKRPVVYIETNIRTLYIYTFFKSQSDVADKEIYPYLEETLDREDPRRWYSALMDYGVYIKKTAGNLSRKSKHHVVQSKFEGSKRQIRGQIITLLTEHNSISLLDILNKLDFREERVVEVIADLEREGFITKGASSITLR